MQSGPDQDPESPESDLERISGLGKASGRSCVHTLRSKHWEATHEPRAGTDGNESYRGEGTRSDQDKPNPSECGLVDRLGTRSATITTTVLVVMDPGPAQTAWELEGS